MNPFKKLGLAAAGVLLATQVHAKPPFLSELSYQKEIRSQPQLNLSQQPGQRRVDKYRPHLRNAAPVDTEIAAFEEVTADPAPAHRLKRRDRVH